MEMFSRFFATVAERWPAASRCLEEYERLLSPVKQEFVEFLAREALRIAEEASSMNKLVASVGMHPVHDLDLNFGTFFNAASLGMEQTLTYNPYIPMDWHEEFNFGVDEIVPQN